MTVQNVDIRMFRNVVGPVGHEGGMKNLHSADVHIRLVNNLIIFLLSEHGSLLLKQC